MLDIDVSKDLETVEAQLQTLVNEIQGLDQQRGQLAQQIQNLNGIVMYLKGKQPSTVEVEETEPTPIQEE
jgi:prefoldin subunit 5